MVLNSKKCYFTCIGIDGENETFTIKDVCYKNTKKEDTLGIILDTKMNFDSLTGLSKSCSHFVHNYFAVSKHVNIPFMYI